jgi:hypothetical protein
MFGDDQSQARRGDLIAIIFGCSTPLVIRPHGRYFKVVGEGYVQGVMNGEAMDHLKEGRFQVQEFTFC